MKGYQQLTIGKYSLYRNEYDGDIVIIVYDEKQASIHEKEIEELIEKVFKDRFE
jgi:hypothetical protein